MICQTKPGCGENCSFIISNPFKTGSGGWMNIPLLPFLSHWAGWARTCVSCLVYRMESLCFSWQFPEQGTVLHILSLQNFADGLGELTKILVQCKDLPSPWRESSAGSPPRAQWSQTFILASRKVFLKSAWNLVISQSLWVFDEILYFFSLTTRQ